MSLNDQKHIEACALLNRLLQDFAPVIPYRAVIEFWLDENRPEPEAFKSALNSLAAEQDSDLDYHHRINAVNRIKAVNAAHDVLLDHGTDSFSLAQSLTEAVLKACFARPARAAR